MSRLTKLIETEANGEKTGRVAYVLEPEALPEPATGFGWQEDMSFRPGEAILEDGALKQVFRAAVRDGYAIVGPASQAARNAP